MQYITPRGAAPGQSVGPASSAGLEHQDLELPALEVDELLGLMRHVRAEVLAHDDVPEGPVPLVELPLDVVGDVALQVVFVHRNRGELGGLRDHCLEFHMNKEVS